MRTWAETDPKAGLMARKRAALVAAALAAFLAEGYAGSSVNRIAAAAGVSIKTLYRHFESKDDLFVAVIQAACAAAAGEENPAWLDLPLVDALTEAGTEHLGFVLSQEQIALYRVVTRETLRFPQLGMRYREQVAGERTAVFLRYLEHWPENVRVKIVDPISLSRIYFSLLHADLLENALLTGTVPTLAELQVHARDAATWLVTLVESSEARTP